MTTGYTVLLVTQDYYYTELLVTHDYWLHMTTGYILVLHRTTIRQDYYYTCLLVTKYYW